MQKATKGFLHSLGTHLHTASVVVGSFSLSEMKPTLEYFVMQIFGTKRSASECGILLYIYTREDAIIFIERMASSCLGARSLGDQSLIFFKTLPIVSLKSS